MKIPAFRRVGGALVFAPAIVCWMLSLPPSRSQDQTPSYHVAARLVELTVVATDKDGNPVANLEKGDFAVFDNGKPRDLSLCRYEGAQVSDAPKAPSLPPYIFTNRLASGSADERNVTALVLDFANTDPQDQMFVKAQTATLLQALAPKTRVAIYVLGAELRVIHDFTDDMEALRANLARLHTEVQVQGKNSVEQAALDLDELLDQIEARKTPYVAAVFESTVSAGEAAIWADVNNNAFVTGNRVDDTLAALEGLGRHLAPVPGRKGVVWISSGISLFSQRVSTAPGSDSVNPMVGDNLEGAIRKASQRLAQFGVALYGVDARGLTSGAESLAQRQYPPMLGGRYSEVEHAAAQNVDSRAAFSLMTSITGGRYIFGTNDLSEGVKRVTADLRGSYSLGFYLPEEPDGKWHTLKVVVRQPDVRLLYKEGYRSDPSPARPQSWNDEEQRRAMLNPFGSDSIRLNARCAPAAGAEPGTLQLDLQIESEDLAWREASGRMAASVDVYIGEITPGNNVRFQQSKINARLRPDQMEIARSRGLPFRRVWKPESDTLRVRVLVREAATGRTGTVDIALPSASGKK